MKIAKFKRVSAITIFIILGIICFFSSKCFCKEPYEKNVLIISSYSQGDKWEDNEIKSIESTLKENNKNITIYKEFLDSKKFDGNEYFKNLFGYYMLKYSKKSIDLIICCDNNALSFVNNYYDKLFYEIPLVFCSVSNFDNIEINSNIKFTGVTEDIDIKNTIDTALKLHPNAKEALVITNDSQTGKANAEVVMRLSKLGGRKDIKFSYISPKKISDVIESIDSLSDDSIIFILSTIVDDLGRYIFLEDEINSIKLENTPVYSCWDVYLNHGIVGGNIVRAKEQGNIAGKLALRVLNGEDICEIPVVRGISSEYIFDYNLLKKFKVDIQKLPVNSVVLNKPNPVYAISKLIAWVIFFISIVVLVVIIIILNKNIGERKKIEKLLRESQEQLRTVINASPDLICFKDGQGRWREANESCKNLLMLNDVDYIGMTDYQLAKAIPEFKDLYLKWGKSDRIAWEEGDIYKEEEKIKQLDGEIKIFDVVKVPVFNDDGSKKGMVFLSKDITEHKLNERLKKNAEENTRLLKETMEYDKLKTEFFANISHELRTPLNVILSSLQLLQLYVEKGLVVDNGVGLEKRISILNQNSYRLLRLINNLIDITKIDSGFYELDLKNSDIVRIVEDTTLSVADYVESRNINLVFDTDVEEKVIACDAEKIERIILNLLSNSIKFTKSGGKILVRIYDKGDSIDISVKDTGIGIPKDKQKIIFERFRQVDKSLNRNREGSGIGLSLVKSLVELHDGKIEVKSEYGKGSEFIIHIPVKMVDSKNGQYDEMAIGQDSRNKVILEFSDIYS